MALSTAQRALALMGCLRDSGLEPTDPISALVQSVPPTNAEKWAEKFYDTGPPYTDAEGNALAWDDLTNVQKGQYYWDAITVFHRQKNRELEVPPATNDARQQAKDDADSETKQDLIPDDPRTQVR